MIPDSPIRRDIVLIGGGHAHVAVLKRFGMKPEPGVRLTLVARDLETPYSGMLPGHIAGQYSRAEAHIDLRPLAAFANARLVHAPATGLELSPSGGGQVHVAGRPPVAFDIVSIDTGSTPSPAGIEGADHTLPVKPIDDFLAAYARLRDEIAAHDGRFRLVVVGGGAGGTELALALDHRLRTMPGGGDISVTVVEAEDTLLPAWGNAARDRLTRTMAARGIDVQTGLPVTAIRADAVILADGRRIDSDRTILVSRAGAPGWLSGSGLALDRDGFVRVDARLRSPSHDFVFAAGDVASHDGHDLPKSGVYAVRQGPVLAENLRRATRDARLRPFRPQSQTLALVGTGDGRAIAARGRFAAEGRWVWHWKDWIDRRWMRKYQNLPDMTPPGGAGEDVLDAMRCGGCGAKVPAPVLRMALDRLPPQQRDGLAQGLDSPDDAAVLTPPPGKLLVQTVDQFRAFIDDPWLFGRIAANHCLGDVFAMGAEAHSALAAVMLPHGRPAKTAEDLYQLLAGAAETLSEAGAVLAGGHTGEGAEMAFGLTVNGWADPDAILRKAGLTPRDALIVTKPIGTGVLFAADMRAKAKGDWIDAAFVSMLRSAAPCLPVMRAHGVRAATDVTGFGLAGHLLEMLRASGVDARLDLDAVPLLDGALALSQDGIESTLKPDNEDASIGAVLAGAHSVRPLLFDPQTAGGLLFGVPADRAAACLADLRAGPAPDAAIIGMVTDRAGPDAFLTLG